MDSPSPSRQSGFSARNSAVDVSQLDKVNAIPNKAADKVLLSNLCPEDQHYLKFLMENDSPDSEDEQEPARHSSSGAWSPMVQSPMMNKRKGTKPSYAITLSLEDISYIRPSWGISKGIRTIEVDGNRKKMKKLEKKCDSVKDLAGEASNSGTDMTYKYFLLMLTLVVVFLTLPPYLAERKRHNNLAYQNKLRVNVKLRLMEIYRPNQPNLDNDPILRVNFGLGVPANLKPEECDCDVYEAELKKQSKSMEDGAQPTDSSSQTKEAATNCFSCLDWAVRANFRTMVEHLGETGICYNIKWQSYDSLATPLIDCFYMEKNDQWFGLGDILSAEWTLNRLNFGWLSLATNLTAESMTSASHSTKQAQVAPSFGSYVNFSLFSTGGIFIGDLRSDFRLSVKVEQSSNGDAGGGTNKRVCIKASCNEKCSRVWSRADDLGEFRQANNVLEYRICSTPNPRGLILGKTNQRVQLLESLVRDQMRRNQFGDEAILVDRNASLAGRGPLEKHPGAQQAAPVAKWQPDADKPSMSNSSSASPSLSSSTGSLLLPDGIGLIERTIFRTSAEFMPVLDGKSLRNYVDGVVKMGLKTSLILLVDYRWETYIGSLQLNTALFPKWRLLFEILHNKGFKVMLTVKPFVDTAIGAASVNQLFEAGKLYGISQGLNRVEQEVRIKETILRRKGLFSIQNETIEIGQNGSTTSRPYIFKCKESQVGYCVLLDLNRSPTRVWLANQIGRSELLASRSVDGILLAGNHPDGFSWDDHYRAGLGQLARTLFFRERIFALPQWTGDLGYIQLASRPFTWDGLRSVVGSVLNLSLEGFSLVHPGSVWGDLKHSSENFTALGQALATSSNSGAGVGRSPTRKEASIFGEDLEAQERSKEELCIRWLQVGVFLPILQFNNLAPIERYGLQDLLQGLVRIRRLHIIAELKKNLPFTPLITVSPPAKPSVNGSTGSAPPHPLPTTTTTTTTNVLPLIRPVWFGQPTAEGSDTIVAEQFSIGPDLLVAPVLSEGVRQRDIYLPSGFWHDELRQLNMRGGKWLRNYPVELTEIAWFTRTKRR